MPAARESLLDAAFAALARRPWARIRMTDVAAAAGVSRQTLYNEFGGKDGLARALVRREAEAYLNGVERALTGVPGAAGPGERLAAAAVWTVRAGTENPLVRAVLTGCWSERLPCPALSPAPPSPTHPAPRGGQPGPPRPPGSPRSSRVAAVEPVPTPVDLLGQARDRAVRLLEAEWPPGGPVELARACETAARLALSYVLVPAPPVEVASAVRGALARNP
ncbi:TetR family transcriptional regulator [Streptomyces botrytidirepellens]|uniref:TetR/AcrR family transcriptional regulator n=1 Tax=Streptomyces botrytidirepellens TaxID=2486417 RepID=A0A3M8TP40_9ACTN|nr:TetR family transcriptional regulator [Streptomyces botrytidirepellens]RNF94865.1 TetR/AcrR family transcriptional regulator [Streptomyces botrytidirepellens]